MSDKVGRPKSTNPLNVDVKVRFDEKTHNKLVKYCEEHQTTRTEVIRQGVNLVIEKE